MVFEKNYVGNPGLQLTKVARTSALEYYTRYFLIFLDRLHRTLTNKLLIFKQNHIVKYIKLDNFEYDFLFNFKKYKKLSNIQHKYDLEDDIKVQKILSKILRLKLLTY